MAQNRLLLACNSCQEDIVIAALHVGLTTWTGPTCDIEILDDFMVKHSHEDGLNLCITTENDRAISRHMRSRMDW